MIEELCDKCIRSKARQIHSETNRIERLRRVTGKHERSGVLYAADGLLLPGVFHTADVGASAGDWWWFTLSRSRLASVPLKSVITSCSGSGISKYSCCSGRDMLSEPEGGREIVDPTGLS